MNIEPSPLRFYDDHLHFPTPDDDGLDRLLLMMLIDATVKGGNLILNTEEEVAFVEAHLDKLPPHLTLVPYYPFDGTLPPAVTASGWYKIHPIIACLTEDDIPAVCEAVRDPREVKPGISEGAARLVLKMMAKRPADRYPDPDALLEDVRSVTKGKSPKGLASAGSGAGAGARSGSRSSARAAARASSRSSARPAAGRAPPPPEGLQAREAAGRLAVRHRRCGVSRRRGGGAVDPVARHGEIVLVGPEIDETQGGDSGTDASGRPGVGRRFG